MIQNKAPHRNWMPAQKNLELFDDADFKLPENFYDDYSGKEALKVQKLTVKNHMDVRMDFKIPCDTCDTVQVNSWAPKEHGLFDKRFMYEEAMRTPLLADIAIPGDMQGKSLRNIWLNDRSEWRDAIYYHYYEKGFGATPHYGVRTDRYKLIYFYDGVDSWEFYDLETDPAEMKNLHTDPDNQHKIKALKDKLIELQNNYKDNVLQ